MVAALPEVDPSGTACQRWSGGSHSFVRTRDGGFDPARYAVEPLPEAAAKAYVTTHHYSGTYPAAAARYGLYLHEPDGPALVGVAVFGIPAQAKVLTAVFPDLAPYTQSLELSRFVLEGPRGGAVRAPANSESWFLARCFEHLAARGVDGVVSFADPVPRRVGGTTLFPGHIGTIYQASNARYTGRGTARTLTVLPDGTTLTARAQQKVRAREQGHGYVERRLIALGATVPRAGQDPADWLAAALHEVGAARVRHGGCLRYAFTTSRTARRRTRIALPGRPYVKTIDQA
ncbi:hypothetical protein HF998_01185, partial [Cellulomonas hominis]|nr:hypothetical protein [Cellulomonas hominis]